MMNIVVIKGAFLVLNLGLFWRIGLMMNLAYLMLAFLALNLGFFFL